MASSGYRESDGIYTSLSPPVPLPHHPHANFVDFMFSRGFGTSTTTSHKPALIDAKTGESLSQCHLRAAIESLSSALFDMGIRPREVVLILLPNCLQFPIIFNAAIRIGAVVTTMNPLNTVTEIGRQMQDSNPKLIFTDSSTVDKVRQFGLPIVLVVKEEDGQRGEYAEFKGRGYSPSSTSGDSGEYSSGEYPHIIPFSSLRGCGDGGRGIRVLQGDAAAVLYSSGTTGRSKGVVISHGNLISALSVQERVAEEMDPGDRTLVLFPMYHIGGLIWLACAPLLGGATMLLLPRYGLPDLVRAVERYRVSKIATAPPVVLGLLGSLDAGRFDLGSLKTILCAAAPLGREIMEKMLQKFPHLQSFIQMYGMTETVTVGSGGKGVLGSSGKLNATLEAKVIHPQTQESLPPGQKGELLLRGPSIMQGYLNNAVATVESIDEDGWLHTGDLVYFDENGYLFVVDRLKELIKYKGYQVAPAELETLLLTHPSIVDCAVVPSPDEIAGEIPVAFVVTEPGSKLSSGEVLDFIADQVAPYKKIRRVAFTKSIPKSAAGKILRKELKTIAAAKSSSKL